MKQRKRWKKWLKRLLGGGLVLLALGAAVALRLMAAADAKHARFYQSGKSINTFLKEYGKSVRAAVAAKSGDPLMRHYAADYRAPDRGRWALGPAAAVGTAAVSPLRAAGTDTFTPDDLRAELDAYAAGVTDLSDVIVKIDLIEHMDPGRRAVLTVKFILDGRDPGGAYFQDRHFYRWHLENAGDGGEADWRIVRDELVEGVRVAGGRDGFAAVPASASGIAHTHARDPHLDPDDPNARLKFGVIQHAGCGVTAADADGDGRPDLFFPDGVRCRLYRNLTQTGGEGPLHFEDVTTAAGLDGLDRVNCGVLVDLDNDGVKDLVVIRYCAPSRVFRGHRIDDRPADGGRSKGPLVRYTDATAELGFDLNAPALAACVLDYDRDGFPDLYVGVYGNAFTDIPRLPFFARNGGPNRLYRNVGGKRLEEVPSPGCADTGWSMAVAAGDFDGDGWPDLAVANDFGKKSIFRNNRNGAFTEVTKQAGAIDFSGGMGVAVGDYASEGVLSLYFANINSNQRWFGEDATIKQYMRNVVRSKWLYKDWGEYRALHDLVGPRWRELGQMIGKGNTLFRNRGDGTFEEVADSHTTRAGWCWGVVLFDMDNDAAPDIFAANGWITNVNKDDL